MLSFVKLCQGSQFTAKRLLHYTNVLEKLVQFNLSDIGEGIAEVQVKEWHVKEGDKIGEFDDLCEVQSDKAAVTITSRYDGVIKKLYYKVDDVARVGNPLVDIEVSGETNADDKKDENVQSEGDEIQHTSDCTQNAPKSTQSTQNSQSENHEKYLSTPAVRHLIKKHNIDVHELQGSGRDGRVMKEDVLKHLNKPPSNPEQSKPKFTAKLAEDKVVPIRGYTRAMIKSMSEALKIPHFGYSDEFTVDGLIQLREGLKSEAKARGIELTYLPIIIKATSLALTEYPQLNARADQKQNNMIYKANHNITLAMDTPGGLAIPNIKFCEQKTVWEIASDLLRIREAGKKQKLSREDLADGTFSLSNIGFIGGTYVSPILPPPQIVIGALGRIRKVPQFDEYGDVIPANIMNVSWAADHRFVDGATLARFSNRLKEFLESPSTMISAMR